MGAGAEIVNDVPGDPRFAGCREPIRSLIWAPLTLKSEAWGAITLASETPVTYTAPDLKLLISVASLAGPAIENALMHARREQQYQQIGHELVAAVQTIQGNVDQITRSETYQRVSNLADDLRRIMREPRTE